MNFEVRTLGIEDVHQVVALLQGSFDPDLRPFMAYTQHGVGEFLSLPLRYPSSFPDRRLIVAVDMLHPGVVRGFADFRLLEGQIGFLSYICVDPDSRGAGIATRMIETFVAAHPHLNEMQLDVFRQNRPAKSLYAKLGFEIQDSILWITRELPPAGDAPLIHSLPMSVAAHKVYGFCEIEAVIEDSSVRVGRLGENLLRCFTKDSFESDKLLAGMHRIFPALECAFAMVTEQEHAKVSTAHRVINISDRMVVKLDHSLLRDRSTQESG